MTSIVGVNINPKINVHHAFSIIKVYGVCWHVATPLAYCARMVNRLGVWLSPSLMVKTSEIRLGSMVRQGCRAW